SLHRACAPACYTLSLHDALPISSLGELGRLIQALRDDVREDMQAINQRLDKLVSADVYAVEKAAMAKDISDLTKTVEQLKAKQEDRKSTRLNSSHVKISYAVFCL